MNVRRVALVADDHGMFRMGLSLTLRDRLAMDEVVEAASLDDALEVLGTRSDIMLALFDLSMPGMAGAASLAAVREIYPDVWIAVVSANDHKDMILEALQAGVHGHVPKHLPDDRFVRALETILCGEIYVPDSVLQDKAAASNVVLPLSGLDLTLVGRLTPRQRDVLKLLVAGKANKEIARALTLGEGTVKIHMAALFRTLGVHNRAGAVAAGLPLIPHL